MVRTKGSPNKKTPAAIEYIQNSLSLIYISETECKCSVCGVLIKIDKIKGKANLIKHEKSASHIKKIAILLSFKKFKAKTYTPENIHEGIVRAFLSAGIAPNAFDNADIREMFLGCFGFALKSGQHYRTKTLPTIVLAQKKLILEQFDDNDFSLYFDETTDASGRYILNILAKPLIGVAAKTYLISSTALNKTNSENVLRQIEFTLGTLIKDDMLKHRFRYLVSDGAAYCLKAGMKLKANYLKMQHFVCLCHNLHLLAEEIRKRSPLANDLISEIKKATNKNRTNQMLYWETTDLVLPKYPVVTRWGTFIECASFVLVNYGKIKKFVLLLPDTYRKLKNLVENINTKEELRYVVQHKFVVDSIRYLEANNLTIHEQIQKITEVENNLTDPVLIQRLKSILNKNPDFNTFRMNVTADKIDKEHTYLDLTTVEAERSFNFLKQLLSDNRRSIKDENLFYYLSLRINE